MGFRELRTIAAEDARERLAEISKRGSEVADMVEGFFRDRTAQAAHDARDRAKVERERLAAERERRAEAAEETRARMAEHTELNAIWRRHTAMMGRPAARDAGTRGYQACLP